MFAFIFLSIHMHDLYWDLCMDKIHIRGKIVIAISNVHLELMFNSFLLDIILANNSDFSLKRLFTLPLSINGGWYQTSLSFSLFYFFPEIV